MIYPPSKYNGIRIREAGIKMDVLTKEESEFLHEIYRDNYERDFERFIELFEADFGNTTFL